MPSDFEAQLTGIGALSDPTRRALYQYVVAQPGAVSRDQAATGVGVARHIAKFHLDKLLDEGLLAVQYARAPGRRGPGAGRPAKLFSRSSRELAVSVPQRDYALAGRLLAKAITEAQREGVPIDDALTSVSRTAGRDLGEHVRRQAGKQPDPASLRAAAADVLKTCGYEPRYEDADITLVNCPFHAIAQEYTDLVCGMNLELIRGFVETLEHPTLEARLAPTPGRCCVRLTDRTTAVTREVIDKEE
jgi:predicted ArsR family transcriptional regulator